jgi:hypothetical protein
MPRAGFELAIPATKRQQTYALDRVATGISIADTGGKIIDTGKKCWEKSLCQFHFFSQNPNIFQTWD